MYKYIYKYIYIYIYIYTNQIYMNIYINIFAYVRIYNYIYQIPKFQFIWFVVKKKTFGNLCNPFSIWKYTSTSRWDKNKCYTKIV